VRVFDKDLVKPVTWDMIIFMIKIIFYFLFYLLTVPAFAGIEVPKIDPPELIECRSEASCDRDPAHLEKYVADFYKWYVASINTVFSPSWDKLSPQERKERRQDHEKKQHRFLKERISPRFKEWLRKSTPPPGECCADVYDPHFCPSDSDPIICAQDWHDEWMFHASAKMVEAKSDVVTLIATFPIQPNEFGEPSSPYLLSVNMKLIKGLWLVDGVIRLDD